MNINLTQAQAAELEALVLVLQNAKSKSGTVSAEIKLNSTKVEYGADAVKFKLSD